MTGWQIGCEVSMTYSDKVIDHFTNPRNVGSLDKDSPRVGTGIVGQPVCGDVMKLQIEVDQEGRIVDAKFKTFGCGAAIATSSMMTDLIIGKKIDEARTISNKAVAEALGGLPAQKMHCSVLAEEALQSALEDFFKKFPNGK